MTTNTTMTTNTNTTMTKNAILARRNKSNVPASTLWTLQLVTKQMDVLRAMPKDDQKARKAAMKAVGDAMTINVTTDAFVNATRTKQEILKDFQTACQYHDQNPEDKVLWGIYNCLWHQAYDLCEADGDFSEFDRIEAERVW